MICLIQKSCFLKEIFIPLRSLQKQKSIMAIEFKTTKVNNNMKPDEKPRYYAKAISKGTITLNDLSESIAEECSLTKADITAVVIALNKHIIKGLKNGYIVKVGEIGTFSGSLKSTTVDQADNLHAKDVIFNKINYLPEVKTIESFSNIDFIKVNNTDSEKIIKTRGRKPIRRK